VIRVFAFAVAALAAIDWAELRESAARERVRA
jgi:hypothetical protein